jgi:hypothetical protein
LPRAFIDEGGGARAGRLQAPTSELTFTRKCKEKQTFFLRFTCFFRNFATKIAKLLRLGNKNKRICFVLRSTLRNFGRIFRISLYKGSSGN